MNWAWATSLDHLWRSPGFPMWLTLAAAAFFGLLVLVTLARAEKSVANGALTVITLLAVGIAVAATIRGYGSPSLNLFGDGRSTSLTSTALPALSCADELAGDVVLSACEKTLFGSAESVAAAVSYVASQITRLTALGDAATANKNLTPELEALRRAVERDRFGLVAEVLQVRDHCTPTECAAFRSLTDNHQILTNMDEHLYESLVTRYAPTWNAPPSAVGALAALPPSLPTGRPTNAEFPSAASTPPVSIMTPEPGTGTSAAPAARASPAPSPRPAPSPGLAAAKKQPAPKPPRQPAAPGGPTLLSPGPSAPAAAND